jgi:hypothetical protein
MSQITALTQLRVFVPVNRGMSGDNARENQWEEFLCNSFGGFSVNPKEQIKGAWRNPETGKIDHDWMMVYYVWVDVNSLTTAVKSLGDKVREFYGEKATSVIHDAHVTPMIVG